ncbi:hypothetical protein [Lewinella sp. 4G2]|uniref:hypothetical protein n=1 Tax=Lewinella sp. 4G2 TaxID=1803372 RepID=UPI0007B4C1D4|nr:hypothetical protein [Lewinella sp. 4G2]OAV42894.1 hypothetical protein A3850_016860 [Lewinella sp. 4G2]
MPKPDNRRQFLRKAGLGATAALLPLAYSSCEEEKTPTKTAPPSRIVGHGNFTYEADLKWNSGNTAAHPVMHCHEMVLDSRGRLVCSTVSEKADVLVYNKDGKILDSFKHGLVEPHGFTKAGEGSDQTFWLTDSESGRVINLGLDGQLIRELDVPDDLIPEGKQFKPTETTVASNGDVYVADGYGTNLIFHFDGQGKLVNSFGGPDHFDCCHGITLDERRSTPELLITSRAAQNFQRWSLNGEHLQTHELPGLQICRPVISGAETLFAVIVTTSWWHYDGMVAILDKDFNVLSLPGGSSPVGLDNYNDVNWDGETFMNPHDVCADEDGNLYVPQWYSGRTHPVRLKRV